MHAANNTHGSNNAAMYLKFFIFDDLGVVFSGEFSYRRSCMFISMEALLDDDFVNEAVTPASVAAVPVRKALHGLGGDFDVICRSLREGQGVILDSVRVGG